MKRLLIFSLVAVVPVVSGCCRGWPRMSMYRGDSCNSCSTAYAPGIETAYETAPLYQGYEGAVMPGHTLPGPSLPLPGPAEIPRQ